MVNRIEIPLDLVGQMDAAEVPLPRVGSEIIVFAHRLFWIGRSTNEVHHYMKILVTGAGGFIGRGLIERLVEGERLPVRAAIRHRAARCHPMVECVAAGELTPDADWRQALYGVDVVVHLAARAHVTRETAVARLAEFCRVNVEGTVNLARQAVAAGTKRFVFVSSVKVHGNESTGGPFSEHHRLDPREPYAVSKCEAEGRLWQLAAGSNMEVVVVRPPLVYGANAPGNFGRLCRFVQRGVPLPLGATGNLRSLVAIQNLVDFLFVCMRHEAAANETFLVSDGEDLSTTDLIRRLASAMGRPAHLVSVPRSVLIAAATVLGKRDVVRRLLGTLQVDISKARQVLGWRPPISVNKAMLQVAALPWSE